MVVEGGNVARHMVDLRRSHHIARFLHVEPENEAIEVKATFLLAGKVDSFRFHACSVTWLCGYAGC